MDPSAVWTGAENTALTVIRFQHRQTRSESQYRQSYSGPHIEKRGSCYFYGVLELKITKMLEETCWRDDESAGRDW
jgi:hypothetical protein